MFSNTLVVYRNVPLGHISTQCPHPTHKELTTISPILALEAISIFIGHTSLHLLQLIQDVSLVTILCAVILLKRERVVPTGQT